MNEHLRVALKVDDLKHLQELLERLRAQNPGLEINLEGIEEEPQKLDS